MVLAGLFPMFGAVLATLPNAVLWWLYINDVWFYCKLVVFK
ncbi:MAG: hypothetical protein V8S74_02705 [Lachnospirales bacterium]